MLTINQADLFYAAEYALAALLLLLCTWQRGTLDIRRQIGRKVSSAVCCWCCLCPFWASRL